MSTSEYRTTVAKVRMELEADGYAIEAITDAQVEVVGLDPASLTVDEQFIDEDGETVLSEARLALIERYLAGHNILASGVDELRQTDAETASDGSNVSYSGDRDHAGLASTSLGQKAIEADTTGTLGSVTRRSATATVSGCPDTREC